MEMSLVEQKQKTIDLLIATHHVELQNQKRATLEANYKIYELENYIRKLEAQVENMSTRQVETPENEVSKEEIVVRLPPTMEDKVTEPSTVTEAVAVAHKQTDIKDDLHKSKWSDESPSTSTTTTTTTSTKTTSSSSNKNVAECDIHLSKWACEPSTPVVAQTATTAKTTSAAAASTTTTTTSSDSNNKNKVANRDIFTSRWASEPSTVASSAGTTSTTSASASVACLPTTSTSSKRSNNNKNKTRVYKPKDKKVAVVVDDDLQQSKWAN